jgi:hypothetical protein
MTLVFHGADGFAQTGEKRGLFRLVKGRQGRAHPLAEQGALASQLRGAGRLAEAVIGGGQPFQGRNVTRWLSITRATTTSSRAARGSNAVSRSEPHYPDRKELPVGVFSEGDRTMFTQRMMILLAMIAMLLIALFAQASKVAEYDEQNNLTITCNP